MPLADKLGTTELKELITSDDQQLLARIGKAHLGLDKKSRVRVVRADTEAIRLELRQGRVGVSLPPGKKRNLLTIRVDHIEISVKGTEFLVNKAAAKGEISVSVTRGVVQVSTENGRTRDVRQGETFVSKSKGDGSLLSSEVEETRALSALLHPPDEIESAQEEQAVIDAPETKQGEPTEAKTAVRRKEPSPEPSLVAVKQWILNGEFERSEEVLHRRLAKNPRDMAARQLLAASQRKSGRPKEALKTYKKIIADGSPREQNRARFRAGVILQDQLGQHEAAISMFDAYLAETADRRTNAAEARMRLAKSHEAKGNLTRYEQILRVVVKEHGGTQAAERAGRELERLSKP
jgi:hypothetical protein